MARFFVVAYLESFVSRESGDMGGGQGEWYFKCNGKRYPDRGVIRLKAGQHFDPEPRPVFYTELADRNKEIKFDFEVWEEDKGRDDKFLDKEFKLKVDTMNQTFELTDKKQRVDLKVKVRMEESKDF